jgi:hypothetical protein
MRIGRRYRRDFKPKGNKVWSHTRLSSIPVIIFSGISDLHLDFQLKSMGYSQSKDISNSLLSHLSRKQSFTRETEHEKDFPVTQKSLSENNTNHWLQMWCTYSIESLSSFSIANERLFARLHKDDKMWHEKKKVGHDDSFSVEQRKLFQDFDSCETITVYCLTSLSLNNRNLLAQNSCKRCYLNSLAVLIILGKLRRKEQPWWSVWEKSSLKRWPSGHLIVHF